MSYLKYKGYLGTIEPDLETGELFGKLAFIRDLITYEAETLKALEKAFQGEFKHEVRQFQKPYDNQQAEQISLMV